MDAERLPPGLGREDGQRLILEACEAVSAGGEDRGVVGVEAGEHRGAGGRAHRRHVEVGVAQPVRGQAVEVRGFVKCAGIVEPDIHIAQIVGEDEEDIGPRRRLR